MRLGDDPCEIDLGLILARTPQQLNVTVGQSAGFFLYGNWTVPGWFCGDPLLHLFRGGGGIS